MNHQSRILVTGARGLVGSAIVRELSKRGFKFLVCPDRSQLDCTNQVQTRFFFQNNRIDYVFHCAATVGGIHINSQRHGEFLYQNLMMEANVIEEARRSGVAKLLFLGSSCIYPKLAGELSPITEDRLLSGPLEPTNEGYAIAKIAGLKLCEHYRKQYGFNAVAAMLTNAYGPQDNFDLDRAHVIPALMRRFHEAKRRAAKVVEVWGTGRPVREFLHSEDLAKALIVMMEKYDDAGIVNVGCGKGVSVAQLAEIMRTTVGYDGDLVFDASRPDGTPRKILDISKITSMGWKPEIPLINGLQSTYQWALEHQAF